MENNDGDMHPAKAVAIVLGVFFSLWFFVALTLTLGGAR